MISSIQFLSKIGIKSNKGPNFFIIPCFKKQGSHYVFRKMSYIHKCIETNLEGYAHNSNRTGIGSCEGVNGEQDFSPVSTSVSFEIL